MGGNSFGKILRITTFGESHGDALGVVIDGMPSLLPIDSVKLQEWVDRRAPGKTLGTSARREPDQVCLISGIFEGKTTGAPIAAMVFNRDVRSSDYDEFKNAYRPGHADRTTELKYGIRDHRGSGRSSGRETVARVIAGYFASLLLPHVHVMTEILQIGDLRSPISEEERIQYMSGLKAQGDSVGGKLGVVITGCPAGLGEPVFDKLKAELAKAMLSIGGCVGFCMGYGSDLWEKSGKELATMPQLFSGIEGGISSGEAIRFELMFKAVSTVGEKAKKGRHDPCLFPRVNAVVESMAYLVLADFSLRQMRNKRN